MLKEARPRWRGSRSPRSPDCSWNGNELGADVVVKGLRAVTDFDAEIQRRR